MAYTVMAYTVMKMKKEQMRQHLLFIIFTVLKLYCGDDAKQTAMRGIRRLSRDQKDPLPLCPLRTSG